MAMLERDALYANYIDRQQRDIDAMARDAKRILPDWLDYKEVGGLSGEISEKLSRVRPSSMDQASRIEGMTPAALTLILAHLRKIERRKSA